jgi:hypothetical protein
VGEEEETISVSLEGNVLVGSKCLTHIISWNLLIHYEEHLLLTLLLFLLYPVSSVPRGEICIFLALHSYFQTIFSLCTFKNLQILSHLPLLSFIAIIYLLHPSQNLGLENKKENKPKVAGA